MSLLTRLYAALPVWGQHAAVTAYGVYRYQLRFGGSYKDALDHYRSRESFTANEWRRYQEKNLAEVLSLAADHVPYYYETWSDDVKKAARQGQLDEVPLLDKEPLRVDPNAFVRTDRKAWRTQTFHTSGSTGTPITTVWEADEVRRSRAVREARSHEWAGVSFSMPRATFSGRMVEPSPDAPGPFYRFNLIERQIYFSAFHLRPETAADYVKALRKHGTRWLNGYAVSFYLLAKAILDQGLDPPPLEAVITTSEKVTPEMRAVMELAYGCSVYEEYSSVENIMLATECQAGSLHVSPDFGIIEILRPDGSRCEPGEVGEVVATGLMRRLQPLIRYRIGDLATWSTEPCECGRAMPVLQEVVGRIEDVVIGPDGRQLVRFHGIFIDQPNVREGQVIQEALDLIRVRIVPTEEFGPADVGDLEARIKRRMGSAVEVEVETVSEIPRTASGKFRAVISNLA